MAVTLKPRWAKGWARVAAAHSGLDEHAEVGPCTRALSSRALSTCEHMCSQAPAYCLMDSAATGA